jgi:uncharacterized protein YdaU (DUF1376 family)
MKDPAFLFYPGDWITGTLGMTFDEKGAYIELLMMQFSRGHMTEHMIGQVVGQRWSTLQHKFKKDDNGLWYNERLDIEKERRKTYTESRKKNVLGSNQYTKNNSGHMTSHMENENTSLFINSIYYNNIGLIVEKIGKKYLEYDIEYYYESILNWSESGKKKKKDWLATLRNFILSDIRNGKVKISTKGKVVI